MFVMVCAFPMHLERHAKANMDRCKLTVTIGPLLPLALLPTNCAIHAPPRLRAPHGAHPCRSLAEQDFIIARQPEPQRYKANNTEQGT